MAASSQLEVLQTMHDVVPVHTPTPISKLPAELLCAIFFYTADSAHSGTSILWGWSHLSVRARILVTHVCKHWRKVALQCATLWSDLASPGFPEALLTEFLVRSKNAPLSVALRFHLLEATSPEHCQSMEDASLIALSALHRVKTLVVHVSKGHQPSDAVLQRLCGSAPLLESLMLYGTFGVTQLSALRSVTSLMFSSPNSLTALRAGFHCLSWGHASFNRLMHLELHVDTKPNASEMKDFLKALSCMPRLEDLELGNVFCHSYSTDGDDWQRTLTLTPVTLARLKRLHLSRIPIATALLTSFNMPSLRYLHVIVSPEPEQGHALHSVLLQKASTLGPFLTVDYGHALRICAYREACKCTADPRDDSTSRWMEDHTAAFTYRVEFDTKHTPVTDLCSLLPLQDVQTLITGETDLPVEEEWHILAQCMESITDLRIYFVWQTMRTRSLPLDQVLSLKRRDALDGRVTLAFPHLHALIMDAFDFRSRCPHSVTEQLRTGFVQRAQAGAEIQVLRIIEAGNLTNNDLESLREVVPYVESDGSV